MSGQDLRRLRHSFACAARGFRRSVVRERNLRIHLSVMGYVVVAGILGQLTALCWAVLSVCFAVVIATELMNTAVERLCDQRATGYDSFVRDAKDIAAAAVLVCAIGAIGAGIAIFLQDDTILRIWDRLQENLFLPSALVCSVPVAVCFIFRPKQFFKKNR